jgi:hypothetical protein
VGGFQPDLACVILLFMLHDLGMGPMDWSMALSQASYFEGQSWPIPISEIADPWKIWDLDLTTSMVFIVTAKDLEGWFIPKDKWSINKYQISLYRYFPWHFFLSFPFYFFDSFWRVAISLVSRCRWLNGYCCM